MLVEQTLEYHHTPQLSRRVYIRDDVGIDQVARRF